MNVTKTEFAALAKVSRGRVSQWISDGRLGPGEIEGEGRSAKINLEAAAAKLNLKIDGDVSAALSNSQRNYIEITLATADCCTAAHSWESNGPGGTDQAVAAGARMARALAALPAGSAGHGSHKRGRKSHPAKDRAMVHLVAMASTNDGLPDNQRVIVDWLRDRLATEGNDVLGVSTLGRWVSEFLGWASSLDQTALDRFHNSPALQREFDNPEEYLEWCHLREKLERKWLHVATLQAQFPTPSEYVESALGRRTALTVGPSDDSNTPKVEL